MNLCNSYLLNMKPYNLASHKIWSNYPDSINEILKLDWNESTIPPSSIVKKHILEFLDGPEFFNLYPTTRNFKLLDLLSSYAELPVDNIQYFGSSDYLHEYICKTFINLGTSILILGPTYDNFRLTSQANGGELHFYEYEQDFSFNSSKFEKLIKKYNPSFIYICNPNNPTGNFLMPDYIKSLITKYSNIMFLVDEAYIEFSGHSCKDLVLNFSNLLITRTMSKAWGLANFRIGYLLSNKMNIEAINKIRNPKNISTLSQEAAIACLSDVDYMKNYVKEVNQAKDWFLNQLKLLGRINIPNNQHEGNFLLLIFPSYEEKIETINYLESKNIFIRNTMQSKILESCARITIGLKIQMERVISTLKEFYDSKF